jgi:hypothetical protein
MPRNVVRGAACKPTVNALDSGMGGILELNRQPEIDPSPVTVKDDVYFRLSHQLPCHSSCR